MYISIHIYPIGDGSGSPCSRVGSLKGCCSALHKQLIEFSHVQGDVVILVRPQTVLTHLVMMMIMMMIMMIVMMMIVMMMMVIVMVMMMIFT
jgi:hypothetical protein